MDKVEFQKWSLLSFVTVEPPPARPRPARAHSPT